jgi:hypothetical protein
MSARRFRRREISDVTADGFGRSRDHFLSSQEGFQRIDKIMARGVSAFNTKIDILIVDATGVHDLPPRVE